MSQNPCRASCSMNTSKHTTDQSSSANWMNMSSYTQFMEALILFMNESWSFVAEFKEKSHTTDALKMSEEERLIKIKEIVELLEVKEKELKELEEQKAKLERSETESAKSATGTQVSFPAHSLPASPAAFKPWANSSFRQQYRNVTAPARLQQQSYNESGCLQECYADCSPQHSTDVGGSYSGAAYYTPPIPGPSVSRAASRSAGAASASQRAYQTGQYSGYGCDPACQFANTRTQ